MSPERRRHFKVGAALMVVGFIIAGIAFAYEGDSLLFWVGRLLGMILVVLGVRYLITT